MTSSASGRNKADVYVYPVGYDKDYNLTEPIWTLTGEGANAQAGKHRMTWDMAKGEDAVPRRNDHSTKSRWMGVTAARTDIPERSELRSRRYAGGASPTGCRFW